MRHTHSMLTLLFYLIAPSLFGQINVRLSIENESISGTDYLFDIYLQRISSGSEGNLYLGNADFIIAFNENMFSSPGIEKQGPPPTGNCTFLPLHTSTINNLITQSNYFSNTAINIEGQYLIINLNGPTPSDTSTFNGRVAKVDHLASTHCLGRFKISGVSDLSADANLRWKTKGLGLKTMIFHLDSIAPFNSILVDLQTDSNTCPDYLTIPDNTIISGHYQAMFNLSAEGEISNASDVYFRAGNSIELSPEFSVTAGSVLEMVIGGCQ